MFWKHINRQIPTKLLLKFLNLFMHIPTVAHPPSTKHKDLLYSTKYWK